MAKSSDLVCDKKFVEHMEAVIARLNKEGRADEALHANAIFFLCKKHDRAVRAEMRILSLIRAALEATK